MVPNRLQFDLSLGRSSAQRRPTDSPLRILVLADLGGSGGQPMAERRPQAVDIDSLAAVFGRLAPALTIELDGMAITLRFESIEDFHPDRLYERLPVFGAMRRLRSELESPVHFGRAAAALGLSTVPTNLAHASAAATSASDDIERLLGRKPGAVPSAATGMSAALDHWLRGVIAPYVVPDVANEQRVLLAAADDALSAVMRQVLHHPRFQALEASWRGIERLVRGLDLGESLQLFVLDATREEIERDLAAHCADPAGSALHGHLVRAPGESLDRDRFGLLVVDLAFGPAEVDVLLLATLGAMAARADMPLLASATPQAAGAADLAHLAEPSSWLAADSPQMAHWSALRASPMAAWIGVVLPRVMMRLPYGAATDPIVSFDFEEMPAPLKHEDYLWGHGSSAVALLAGLAFQHGGWSKDLDSEREIDDLPSHVVTDDDGKHQQPCAELLLGERAGEALLARGLMPLLSWRDRNAVTLLRWRSLAAQAAGLSGLGP